MIGCNDVDGSCEALASFGYCENENYKDWMKPNCPKSCGYCTSKYITFGNIVYERKPAFNNGCRFFMLFAVYCFC